MKRKAERERERTREIYMDQLNVLSDNRHELKLIKRHKGNKEKHMDRKSNAGKWTKNACLYLQDKKLHIG